MILTIDQIQNPKTLKKLHVLSSAVILVNVCSQCGVYLLFLGVDKTVNLGVESKANMVIC